MEIDIRKKVEDKVTEIRFEDAPPADGAYFADVLVFSNADCNVWIQKSSDYNQTLGIKNKKTAYNLIAAINKAIDLGWFEE